MITSIIERIMLFFYKPSIQNNSRTEEILSKYYHITTVIHNWKILTPKRVLTKEDHEELNRKLDI